MAADCGGFMMRVRFKDAHKFPGPVRQAIRAFARKSDAAFLEVMGASAPILDVHPMTPDEVEEDTAAGGGDGYMQILPSGKVRVAIRPGVTPYRACEVWTEEQVHALRPDLSESVVRGYYVPTIVKKVLA